MDTQKLTCFLFHCFISCLSQTGHWLFCGLYLYFLISLTCEVRQPSPVFSDLLFTLAGIFLISRPVWHISSVHINASYTPVLLLFLLSSIVPVFLVCSFWAMLSSPAVILQPYGLPVYPQTTTCYPSIVQVNPLCLFCKSKWLRHLSSQSCIIKGSSCQMAQTI